ncbi:MAG: hypothetical protein ACRDTT_21210 [Pseudonocardiaceae bacterium]
MGSQVYGHFGWAGAFATAAIFAITILAGAFAARRHEHTQTGQLSQLCDPSEERVSELCPMNDPPKRTPKRSAHVRTGARSSTGLSGVR